MQAADPEAVGDGIGVQPRTEELVTRDHSVLPSREPSEHRIDRRGGSMGTIPSF
jgi:hypothetical protein